MKKNALLILVIGAALVSACAELPTLNVGGEKAADELGLQEIVPIPTAATVPDSTVFRDDMDEDINKNWGMRIISGLEEQLLWGQANGKLRLQTMPPNDVNYAFLSKNQNYDDVIVQAEVENIGPTNNFFSLICRANPAGWYEFRISSDGYYELLRFDQYKKDEGKVAYTNLQDRRYNSTKINEGLDKNTFAISCIGNEISAFINGEQLYWEKRPLLVEDEFHKEGAIGFGVLGFGDSLDVNYNWVEAVKP